MINTQQLIVMMPLFKIQLPTSASGFFKNIMAIAAFDLYEFDEIIHKAFKINPTEPLDINFETIGFESRYHLVNLGSIFIFYVIYLALLLLVLPLLGLKRSCRGSKKCLARKLKWSLLITLMNESYQILIVCVLLNMQVFSMESTGLSIMSLTCVFFLTLAIVLPLIIIIQLALHGP